MKKPRKKDGARDAPMTAAERELAEAHAWVVTAVVRRHFGAAPRRAREEFEAVGYVALCRAAQRFDPEVGVKFSTYAGKCVWGQVARFRAREWAGFVEPLADANPAVHRAAPVDEAADVLDRAARCLARCTPANRPLVVAFFGLDGSPPKTLGEIGAALGVSQQSVGQRVTRELFHMSGAATTDSIRNRGCRS